MKTYLVNLDKNPERLESSKRQLDALGIHFERIRAVQGKSLTRDERKRMVASFRSLMACGRRLNDGEIGCSLSHVAIYRDMVEKSVGVALVLEDDLVLQPGFREAIEEIARVADPTKPQVFFPAKQNAPSDSRVDHCIERVQGAMFTDVYVITLPAARLVLQANYPVVSVADSWSHWYRRYGVELYRRFPIVAYQDNNTFGTDICVAKQKRCVMMKIGCKLFRAFGALIDWFLWRVCL